jgi:hypothetical protein
MPDIIDFDEAVSRGKVIAEQMNADDWKLAELAARLPSRDLRRFAAEIGVPYGKLLRLRRTFRAYAR